MTQAQIEAAKLAWLESLVLAHGAHEEQAKAACVMEAVAHVAGEPWSDHPKCASPVIAAFCRRLNDRWGETDRQRLKPFVVRLVGTSGSKGLERARAFACADWSCREVLPLVLDARFPEWAAKLRALAPVTDGASAQAARDLAHQAPAAAYADDADDAAAAYADDADDASAADADPSLKEKLILSSLAHLDRLIAMGAP